jgi:hypothetical protein
LLTPRHAERLIPKDKKESANHHHEARKNYIKLELVFQVTGSDAESVASSTAASTASSTTRRKRKRKQ